MTHIRNYQPSDEPAIRHLFERVFGQVLSEEQWRWKYQGSIAKGALPTVALDEGGAVIGHAGAVLLRGIRGGKPISFLQICDVMVAPEARGYLGARNVATRLIRSHLETLHRRFPDAVAYGFPGERPFKVGAFCRAYDLLEPAYETRLEHMRDSPWIRVARAPMIDHRLDRLWRKLQSGYALCLARDKDYITWRYEQHPTMSYERLNVYSFGRVLGWAILLVRGEKTLIVDAWFARTRLAICLSAVSAWLAAQGYPPVVVWLPERDRVRIHGTHEQTPVRTTNMVWGFEQETSRVRAELFYTMGDLDIF